MQLRVRAREIGSYQPSGVLTFRAKEVLEKLFDLTQKIDDPYALCWAVADINRDGRYELIFLDEDYNVKMIFGLSSVEGATKNRPVYCVSFLEENVVAGLDGFGNVYAAMNPTEESDAWWQERWIVGQGVVYDRFRYGFDGQYHFFGFGNIDGGGYYTQKCYEQKGLYEAVFSNLSTVTKNAVGDCARVLGDKQTPLAIRMQTNVNATEKYRVYYDANATVYEGGSFALTDLDGDGYVELSLMRANGAIEILKWNPDLNYSSHYLLDRFTRVYNLRSDGTVTGEYVNEDGDQVTETVKLGLYFECQYTVLARVINDGERYFVGDEEVDKEAYLQFRAERNETPEVSWRAVNQSNLSGYFQYPNEDIYLEQIDHKVDLSTYEGILEAYRLTVLDAMGMEDVLFSCEREEDKEFIDDLRSAFYANYWVKSYWNSIYSGNQNGQNAFGYALRDYNGDGVDELVLMLDNHHVFAVFTQRDGAPALLLLGNDRDIWMDENGLFYTQDTFRYGAMITYTVYELAEDATLLEKLVLGWNNPLDGKGYYEDSAYSCEENGERRKLSKDEFFEYLEQYEGLKFHSVYVEETGITDFYRRLEEIVKMDEQLKFIPLFERTTWESFSPNIKTLYGGSAKDEYWILIQSLSEREIKLAIGRWLGNRVCELSATLWEDGCYHFEWDGGKGKIELIAGGLWLYVDGDTEDGRRVYYFDRQGFAKG